LHITFKQTQLNGTQQSAFLCHAMFKSIVPLAANSTYSTSA